jgi:hypothetical protein
MFKSFISSLLLTNKKGDPSYSRTMVAIAFVVINIKLIFSGLQVGTFLTFSPFSGIDYAAALTAIAALHVSNKAVTKDNTKDGN